MRLIVRKKLKPNCIKAVSNRNRFNSLLHPLLVAALIGIILPVQSQDINQLHQELNNKKTRINAALQLSDYYLYSRDKTAAVYYATEAIDYCRREDDVVKQRAYSQLAQVYSGFEVYDSAITFYQQALSFITDSTLYFQQLVKIANNHKALLHFDEAESYYLQSLHYFNSKWDPKQVAEICNFMGSLYWAKGLHTNALTWYDSALVYNHEIDFKINILNNKALCYKEASDYTNAIDLHQEALQLAIKTHSPQSIANTYNFLGSVYFRNNVFDSASSNYRKAIDIYLIQADSAGLLRSSTNLANTYQKAQLYDSAIAWNQRALNYITPNTQYQFITLYNSLGNIYNETGDFKETAEYYFRSLRIANKLNDIGMQAQTYNRLSQLYASLNNFEKAEYYLKQSIEFTELLNNPTQLAYRINLLGNLYSQFEDYTSALLYYKHALTIRENLGDDKSIAQTLNNIGNTYRNSKKYALAIDTYQKALTIYLRINDQVQQCYVLNNLGNTELENNHTEQAKEYFQQAYTLSKDIDNLFIEGLTARKLGEYYLAKQNNTQADAYFQESYAIGKQTDHKLLQQSALYQLYLSKMKENDLGKALEYYIRYAELEKQSIANRNNQQIFETQLNYQLQLKTDTIKNIEDALFISRHNEQLKSLEAKRYKDQRTLFFILVLVSLSAGTAILFLLLQNKKKKRLLDEAYYKTKMANLKLIKSEAILKELNATKDKFFSIIGHDLRGPISGLMNLTGILNTNYDALSPQDLKDANLEIHKSSKSLYTLLDNLLNWSRAQTGRIPFNPNPLLLSQLVTETFDALAISARDKNITLTNKVDPKLNVMADKEMLSTIIRNLVSNSIKFTPETGLITVHTELSSNGIQVNISDTGVGMPETTKNKLFKIDEEVTTLGTNKEKGTGLGLVLCKEFVKKHRGKIWVDSEEGQGTTFSFTLNYKA